MKIMYLPHFAFIGLKWATARRIEEYPKQTPNSLDVWRATTTTRTYHLCLIPCFPIVWETKSVTREITLTY